MTKSYAQVAAMAQPDRTACWTTSMAWWTKTLPKVKDFEEIDILGRYHHLTGSDGGLNFPEGYKSMLSDPLWGMTIHDNSMGTAFADHSKTLFKRSPVMCGYWDYSVGGYHSVALYGFKHGDGVWAMDPNGGVHVFRTFDYYFQPLKSTILGYIKDK